MKIMLNQSDLTCEGFSKHLVLATQNKKGNAVTTFGPEGCLEKI